MGIRSIVLLGSFAVMSSCSMFSQATPAAQPTTSNAEGKAAVDRLIQAFGGASKLNAVKTLSQTVTATGQGQEIKIEQRIVYPDKQSQIITMPQGVVREVVTPTVAFIVMGAQQQDLPASQRSAAAGALKLDFINVLQHVSDPKYTFIASGKEKLDNVEATVVEVNADGAQARWWIGADGKLLQEESSILGQAGSTTRTLKYSDWKPFGGLQYPSKFETLDATGKPRAVLTLTAMEVNGTLDPKAFEKPQPQDLPAHQ
jgi:hypothetical protein